MRESGILLPISSIPSEFGIGGFSKEAYDFVDFVTKSGSRYWQILPLGPTGYGDSPYQSFSTYAGNPYYIDLEKLIAEGLLTREECEAEEYGPKERYVDYEKIYFSRFTILRKAFDRWKKKIASDDALAQEEKADYEAFLKESEDWLPDYALYMAVKNAYGGKSWSEWDEDIKTRKAAAIRKAKKDYAEEIEFYCFQQYYFDKQWKALKKYANRSGVKIIGDIPIYVAFDSADAWANPKLFLFDADCNPIDVAGCPPDPFAATGQLWGNPLYNWKYHKKNGYSWWVNRIRHCFKLYDVVRVDHFRGFDEFYAIPAGNKTAEIGEWRKGPGIDLFNTIKKELGDLPIIAEDLGFLTDSVYELLAATGYPGMKVLQFAFDSREPSNYLPHNYNENCIVYTGTHDNDTTKSWYAELPEEDRNYANEYLGKYAPGWDGISWDFIRLAFSSVAKMVIIPMQDYLCLGADARLNTPSTLGDNWKWRLTTEEYSDALALSIRRLNALYQRGDVLPKKKKKEDK